jgi:hypothetical protein
MGKGAATRKVTREQATVWQKAHGQKPRGGAIGEAQAAR